MKESKACDGRTAPCKKFKHRSAEGAGDTTGRARFEDSASEEGTIGRTRARTSCPVQEPRGVSLESGYITNLSVPTPAEEQQHHRPGKHQGVQDCTSSTTGRGTDRDRCKEDASVGGTGRRSARSARSAQPGNPREPGLLEIARDSRSGEGEPYRFFYLTFENDNC